MSAHEVTEEMIDEALAAVMRDPEVPTGVRPHILGGEVLVIRERTDAEPIVRATLATAFKEVDRRMAQVLDTLEAAEQRAAEYAAVVEKVRDIIHGPSGLTINEEKVWMVVHNPTAPADALRELKADVWDEGWSAAGAWQIAAPGTPYPWNPYREEQGRG